MRLDEGRLARLLPNLVAEFDGVRTPEEIRACADAILSKYDDAPVRSFVLRVAFPPKRDGATIVLPPRK